MYRYWGVTVAVMQATLHAERDALTINLARMTRGPPHR